MESSIEKLKEKQQEENYLTTGKKFMRAAKEDKNGTAVIEMINLYKKEKINLNATKIYREHYYYMCQHSNVKDHLVGKEPPFPELEDVLSAIKENNVDEAIRALGYHVVRPLNPLTLLRVPRMRDQINII